MHVHVFAAVLAVKVALQLEHMPVLKAHWAQFAGQSKQLFTPSLNRPAGQLMMSTHSLVEALYHCFVGSGLQAHFSSVPKV